uniref:GED domain-containing protein n=1 Tax=Panagrolaimus davidi TaxID=227884 RepID=A0A914R541_9BILA
MVHEYIEEKNTLILAVSQANNDLANSKAISNASISDKDGLRTINVLTQLDIMDEGTDAYNVLTKPQNKNIGNIGVVNRSQADIISKKRMEYCLKKEENFFRKKYPNIAAKHGIKYLSERLSEIYKKYINKELPTVKKAIKDMEQKVNLELQSLGTPIGGDDDKQQKAFYAIDHFTDAYVSVIKGSSKTLVKSKIIGGALIADTFHTEFCKNMKELKPLGNLNTAEIIIGVKNASVRITVFRSARRYLNSRLEPTKECVQNLVEMQCAYINRKHPHFINPPKADPQAEQLSNSNNKIASFGVELSDSDKRDVKEIERLVEVYFKIVVQTMQDMVPKAIMMFLVNYFEKNLREHLRDKLKNDFSTIVVENSDISKKRAELKKKLQGLNLSFDLFKQLEKE